MNHNFPCSPEGGKISQLNNIILYHAKYRLYNEGEVD